MNLFFLLAYISLIPLLCKQQVSVLKIDIIHEICLPSDIYMCVHPPPGLQSTVQLPASANMTGLSVSPSQSPPRADNTQLHAQIPASSPHREGGRE